MPENEGFIVWDDIMPPTNITISVDANENPTDHISTVLHELLHVTLFPLYIGRMVDDYAEVMVLAYEKDMYAYVKKSKDRLARWNDIIGGKLAEAKDGTAQ